jgi:glycosyltransferase involved in cell wall biosynthesis
LSRARPLRVLELRAVTGQGGGPEKGILLAATADLRRVVPTLCFLRRPGPTPLWVHARAATLGIESLELEERHGLEPRTWPALRRLVRARGIDLVHSHDYRADFFACLLSKVEPIVALSTAHGWVGSSLRERWVYGPLGRLLLTRFPLVRAVSPDIVARLIRAGADPDRVRLHLNPVDPDAGGRDEETRRAIRADLGVGPDDYLIGAVGRLAPEKRFDLLIDALAALRPNHPRLRAAIAGEGRLAEPLRRRAADAGLDGALRFLGHRLDVGRLHAGFDLLVQSSDREGSAFAVLEAMGHGVAVVATRAGATAELLRDEVDGLLVPTGDAAALAAAIAKCLADPAAARERAGRALERARQHLSLSEWRRRLLEAYETVYESARPGLRRE